MAEVNKEYLRQKAAAAIEPDDINNVLVFEHECTPGVVMSLLDENAALAARIAELQRQLGEYRDALQFAARSLATVTSSDGSGHADLALIALKMAGVQEDERASLVEKWKAWAQWRIDKARAGAPA